MKGNCLLLERKVYTRKSRFFFLMHYFCNKVPDINFEDIYKDKFFLTHDHLLCDGLFFIEIIYGNGIYSYSLQEA